MDKSKVKNWSKEKKIRYIKEILSNRHSDDCEVQWGKECNCGIDRVIGFVEELIEGKMV